MTRTILMIMVVMVCGLRLPAQAPLIDVSQAVAEFISDDENPRFTIRGIYVTGHVDTMKAVIKTSTVRVVGGEYARYKPVFDRIRWVVADSARSEVFVDLHLEGKALPLPADSVRGSVRMTVSAAHWDGSEWLGTSSEQFSVPVINAPIPKPLVNTSNATMRLLPAPAGTNGDRAFTVSGITMRLPTRDTIDRVPDVRTYTFGEPIVDPEDKGLTVDSTVVTGEGDVRTMTIHGHLRQAGGTSSRSGPSPTATFRIRSRLLHGQVPGGARMRSFTVPIRP